MRADLDNVPANERTQICSAGRVLWIRWMVSGLVVGYRWYVHATKASGADVCELRRDFSCVGRVCKGLSDACTSGRLGQLKV